MGPSSADFAALSSLVGTLGPEGLLSLMEAQNAETQADLATQTAEAGRQASSAQGAYQGLAAAPPPSVGGAGFVPQLFGNVASVLSEDPSYAQRGAATVKGMQDDLMTTRRENLQSLRDIYSQRAQLFEKAGDLEQAEKLRAKHESVSKAMEVMLQKQRMDATATESKDKRTFEAGESAKDRRARIAEISARGAQDRLTADKKPKMGLGERAALVRQGIDPETNFTLPSFAQREMTRNRALAKKGDTAGRDAARNGILTIATTRWTSDKTLNDMTARLTRLDDPFYGPGKNEARYALTEKRIWKKVKDGWERDPSALAEAVQAALELSSPWWAGE